MALMTDQSSSAASSSTSAEIYRDILALVAPADRPGYRAMFENAVRGRELPDDELRRVAVTSWHQFCKYGWPRNA
jgi:hypothetical protein